LLEGGRECNCWKMEGSIVVGRKGSCWKVEGSVVRRGFTYDKYLNIHNLRGDKIDLLKGLVRISNRKL
jgi:hypothetical protein